VGESRLIKTLVVNNTLGIHARAAAKIVALGKQYKSKIRIRKDDREVDGSSILSILTLACPTGTDVQVIIEGEDSEPFMESLTELFERKFGETDDEP
jgi:phosphocarrier protein